MPIDYVRIVEIPLSLSLIDLLPGDKALDVSSPKIISLYLAKLGGIINVIDMLDNEIEFFKFHAKKDKIIANRINAMVGDVRDLKFHDEEFDVIYSISVLEHIFPKKGGDSVAIKEMARVLKPGGRIVFTVPYTKTARIEYKTGSVYERQANRNRKTFFQRWYDKKTLHDNIFNSSGLTLTDIYYIGEKVFVDNPQKRLFMYINNGSRTDLIFGRFYNIIADRCLEISDREEVLEKPYIACCRLFKEK